MACLVLLPVLLVLPAVSLALAAAPLTHYITISSIFPTIAQRNLIALNRWVNLYVSFPDVFFYILYQNVFSTVLASTCTYMSGQAPSENPF